MVDRYRKPLSELYELSRKSCERLIVETLAPLLVASVSFPTASLDGTSHRCMLGIRGHSKWEMVGLQ